MSNINENRKSPTTAHARKCAITGTYGRGSVYTINNRRKEFKKKVNEELDLVEDAEFYNLVDTGSDEVLHEDFITKVEAVNRNISLKESNQPFRWLKSED